MCNPYALTTSRLIVCFASPKAFDAVKAAEWPTMQVHPLNTKEKMQIVTEYLENIYGKTLSEEQKQLVVGANQTNNALYLKALLDEVLYYITTKSPSAILYTKTTAPIHTHI